MPTYTEQLTTIRDQVVARLADITANPKPNYTIGDETYEWTDYQRMLFEQLTRLNEAIGLSQPYEIRTRRLVR